MINLLFDYDGTLHDCLVIYAPAFRAAYQTLVDRDLAPVRTWQDSEISPWLGYTAKQMWDSFAPDLPQAEKDRCSQLIGAEMLRLTQAGHARLYPNIPEQLTQLCDNGFRLILLSNCKRAYLDAHRQQFNLDRWFSACYSAEELGWLAKPVLFEHIRRQYAGNYIVIGDRFHDMDIATTHALPSIACAYGYGSPSEFVNASRVVSSPTALSDAVTEFVGLPPEPVWGFAPDPTKGTL